MLASFLNAVPIGLFALAVAVIVFLVFVRASVKVLREYERAVVFTLGRFRATRGPGSCC